MCYVYDELNCNQTGPADLVVWKQTLVSLKQPPLWKHTLEADLALFKVNVVISLETSFALCCSLPERILAASQGGLAPLAHRRPSLPGPHGSRAPCFQCAVLSTASGKRQRDSKGRKTWVALLVQHYLCNTASFVVCVFRRVKERHNVLHYSPLLKYTRVRQVYSVRQVVPPGRRLTPRHGVAGAAAALHCPAGRRRRGEAEPGGACG